MFQCSKQKHFQISYYLILYIYIYILQTGVKKMKFDWQEISVSQPLRETCLRVHVLLSAIELLGFTWKQLFVSNWMLFLFSVRVAKEEMLLLVCYWPGQAKFGPKSQLIWTLLRDLLPSKLERGLATAACSVLLLLLTTKIMI